MYLVVVYDISLDDKNGQKRLTKVMKKCREFLHHSQRSVFEGEISEGKFKKLKNEIENIIDDKKDYIIFYRIDNKKNVKKIYLGINFDATNNII